MLRILVAIAVSVACGFAGLISRARARSAQVGPEFLLQPGKAGSIELGQTVDQLYARFGRENVRLIDLFTEGMFNPTLQIDLAGAETQPAISAPIREWPCAEFSVWGITVRDRRFRTQDGFGVGSTLGDLRTTHKTDVGWGEGERIAHVPALGMTFLLDDSTSATDSWRVKSVWVVPQPVQVRQKRCPHLGPLGKVGRGA